MKVEFKMETKSCNGELNIEFLKMQAILKAANLLPKDTSDECVADIAEIIFKIDTNEVGIKEVNKQIKENKKKNKLMRNQQKISNKISTNSNFYYDFKMLFKRTVREDIVYETYIVANDGELSVEQYKNGELQLTEITDFKNTKEN